MEKEKNIMSMELYYLKVNIKMGKKSKEKNIMRMMNMINMMKKMKKKRIRKMIM